MKQGRYSEAVVVLEELLPLRRSKPPGDGVTRGLIRQQDVHACSGTPSASLAMTWAS